MVDLNNIDGLRNAAEQFFFAYRAFTSQPDQLLAQRGLGRVHHRILYFVGRHPKTSVNTLLGILGVSKQALNGPLRQLIASALVSVDLAEHDRRVKQLTLTDAGIALEEELTGIQARHLAAAFSAAGDEAAQGWLKVMAAILEKV